MATLLEELKQFEEDMSWVTARYSELAEKYPAQYVAVDRKKVVDHDMDLHKLMGRLKAAYGEKKSRIAVQYVSTQRDELIL